MKRAIIITIIVAAFGWVIYDYVQSSSEDPTSSEEQTIVNGETDTDKDLSAPDADEDGDIAVGLEKGNKAPDFELETLDGEPVKLSDFEGEQVLLNFWATWCPPCRAEMPDMQKFHEDKDVVILAVDLTESETDIDNVPEFLDEFGVTFRVLMDVETEVADLYNIQPIPTSYLIDSDGIIHNMAIGALNYEMMVQEFAKMK